jgi:hypothetical protein
MPWPYRSIRVSLRAMFRLSLSASSPHLLHAQYRCLGKRSRHAAKESRGLEAFHPFRCGTHHLCRLNALKEKS